MKRLLILASLLFATGAAYPASVDTASVFSKSMHREIRCVVIRPDAYGDPALHFPVVYLLHGYSDRYDTWVRKVPGIKACANRFPSQPLAIMIDCGTGDFFLRVNRELHSKMLKMDIPHDYVERPGKHSWEYWSNAVEFQMLFFHRYFTRGEMD